MPMIQEGNNLGDLLKYEGPLGFSREPILLAAGPARLMGTVLAQRPDGILDLLQPNADDSTNTAVGILISEPDSSLTLRDAVMICRLALFASKAVIWPDGLTIEQKTLAINQLKALGVLIRTSA